MTGRFTYRNIKKVTGVVCIETVSPCFFTKEWTEAFIKTLPPEELDNIKKTKPGWYYSIMNLPFNSVYMRDKYLTSKTPVTMVRAENIMDIVKPDEQAKWIDCCKVLRNHAQSYLSSGKKCRPPCLAKKPAGGYRSNYQII
jgi:hypothetical protein